MTEGLVDCPYCAEPIKVEARKCKHCGSDLTGNDVGRRMQDLGEALQSCGCALLMLPIGAIGLFALWEMTFG